MGSKFESQGIYFLDPSWWFSAKERCISLGEQSLPLAKLHYLLIPQWLSEEKIWTVLILSTKTSCSLANLEFDMDWYCPGTTTIFQPAPYLALNKEILQA